MSGNNRPFRKVPDSVYEEALEHMVRHHCGALMVPATTTLSWWDCINPYCESDAQPVM